MTLSRPASRWYALLLAAAATLALNPRVSADPGWQLSFAAVAGILALGRPLAAALARAGEELIPVAARPPDAACTPPPAAPGAVPRSRHAPLARALVRGLADGVAITVAATLATAPLLAFHFGSVPLAGLARQPARAARRGARHVARHGQGRARPRRRGGSAGAGARRAARPGRPSPARLSRGPRRALRGHRGQPARASAALRARRGRRVRRHRRRHRRPYESRRGVAGDRRAGQDALERAAAWRRAPRSFRVAVLVLALTVLALATATGLGSPSPPGDLTVRFLDVGQGDATLVQDGHGANALFDAGPPEAGVYRAAARGGREAARPRRLDAPLARPPGRVPRADRADADRPAAHERLRHPRLRLPPDPRPRPTPAASGARRPRRARSSTWGG